MNILSESPSVWFDYIYGYRLKNLIDMYERKSLVFFHIGKKDIPTYDINS